MIRISRDHLPRFDGDCAGRWSLFDAAEPDEDRSTARFRHAAAARICRGCPALTECRTWADSLPPRHRPPGVLAGRIPAPQQGAGRPKKSR